MVKIIFSWSTKDGLHSVSTEVYNGEAGDIANAMFNACLAIGTDMEKSGVFGIVQWQMNPEAGSK